ncbi:MAG: hypothetical protein ACC742_09305, partial [Thermoanaerobaculales bacterium]
MCLSDVVASMLIAVLVAPLVSAADSDDLDGLPIVAIRFERLRIVTRRSGARGGLWARRRA